MMLEFSYLSRIAQPFSAIGNFFSCCKRKKHNKNFKEVTVFSEEVAKAIVPEFPLAMSSLQIVPIKPIDPRNRHFHVESQTFIHRIVGLWRKHHLDSYLIYGTYVEGNLQLEIVPYGRAGGFFRKAAQLRVLANIASEGGPKIPKRIEERMVELYQKTQNPVVTIPKNPIPEVSTDPFCNQEVIDRQLIHKGKYVSVLYDRAPIQKEHFLIVPHDHSENFTDLTKLEYMEMMTLAGQIALVFKKFKVHFFMKNGKEAGQTVPHCHLHVVVEKDRFALLTTIVKNILCHCCSRSLSSAVLQSRITNLKAIFSK